MQTVILAAGLFPTSPTVISQLAQADFIACCDGAANTCVDAGFTPDVVVGDGDSVRPELAAQLGDRLVRIAEQETNDLWKTFRHCLALGHRHFTLLGATGKREDHALANLTLLMEFAEDLRTHFGDNWSLQMVSDYGTFTPCRHHVELQVDPGQEVSIFNFGAKGFRATGLQYTPYDFTRLWQGTLNVAIAPRVTIDAEGDFLVYVAQPD